MDEISIISPSYCFLIRHTMGIIQEWGKKDIFLSEIIFWMHVRSLFSVCLIHDIDDTMVYFQRNAFFSGTGL